MTHGALLALMVLIACTSGCASSIHQRPRVDGVLYPEPSANAITFWGHACCYIDVGGFGIVTDPVFETSAWGRTRHIGAPPRAAYASARLILISHAHDNHLSPSTIATFPDSVLVLCPAPSAPIAM